jgi:chromatin segregation and condensation protein Rec8/ScpA/Scc1 (kleisin family)
MSFEVQLAPHFEGPLTQLLDRIVRKEIALGALPLEPLARQLVAYLAGLSVRERLDNGIDEIALAARLIRWKTLSLLGEREAEAALAVEREVREEVREALLALERRRMEAVRIFLTERLEAQGGCVERDDQRAAFLPRPAAEVEEFPSLWTLRQKFQWLAADAARARAAGEQAQREIAPESASVAGMLLWLARRLAAVAPGTAVAADLWFAEAGSLPRRHCLFLALLELGRRGALQLAQSEAFAPIQALVGDGQRGLDESAIL